MVCTVGFQGTTWYIWDRMDTWDCMSGEVYDGTYYGIPVYHMVHLGRDGHVGLGGTGWYVLWDPSVPHGTFGTG